MRTEGNTIFITGGTSGIGKGLAEAFHKLGNEVIIAGRREDVPGQLCAENSGMQWFRLDVTDPAAIRSVAAAAIERFPKLNCVFNNAGVQHGHDFSAGGQFDDDAMADEINTNLAGLIRVTAAFLPHLKQQENATLVNVSSGLGFIPMARFPIYCATKAAVHSFTLSLRHQLRDSKVKVIELIPPYVATNLGSPRKTVPQASAEPGPMPLDQFIAETIRELAGEADEVAIGPSKRWASAAAAITPRVF